MNTFQETTLRGIQAAFPDVMIRKGSMFGTDFTIFLPRNVDLAHYLQRQYAGKVAMVNGTIHPREDVTLRLYSPDDGGSTLTLCFRSKWQAKALTETVATRHI